MRPAYPFILLLALVPAAAQGADTAGTYFTPHSAGTAGCADFLVARDRERQAKPGANQLTEMHVYMSYVSGFQTAYNLLVPETCDIFAGLKSEQMLAWMDNYCRGQPTRSFGAALVAMVQANQPSRSRSCR